KDRAQRRPGPVALRWTASWAGQRSERSASAATRRRSRRVPALLLIVKMWESRGRRSFGQLRQELLDPLVQPVPVAVAREGDLHQAVDQLGERDAGQAPEAGVHGDAGEAGEGVDLVEIGVFPFQKEVDAGEAGAADGGEGADRDLAQAVGDGRRE